MMNTSERRTWQQIRECFPDQWVVLVEYRSYGCRYTGTIRGPMFRLRQLTLER